MQQKPGNVGRDGSPISGLKSARKKIYFHSTSVGANRNPADWLEGRKSICLNKYDFTSMHGKFGTEVKSEVKRGTRHKEDKKTQR